MQQETTRDKLLESASREFLTSGYQKHRLEPFAAMLVLPPVPCTFSSRINPHCLMLW